MILAIYLKLPTLWSQVVRSSNLRPQTIFKTNCIVYQPIVQYTIV